MPLLNPYLRAFFRSALPAQCTPVEDYILLVPTTEILTNTRDRETGVLYADLVGADEFLGSHVLRVPNSAAGAQNVSGRETRGKPRQFTTVNGRTVVVKDTWVYSNKGFRNLNQAQLLNDTLYYPDASEPQQWLIYMISKPLIGSLEYVPTIPPYLRDRTKPDRAPSTAGSSHGKVPQRKEVHSFNELLMMFPMIARQMQPGLQKVFQGFEESFEKYKPLPLPPPSPVSTKSGISTRSSVRSTVNGDIYRQAADESEIRRFLESAISAAVDLFQRVDQSQLDLLASTTDLTGPAVDRLIERYVAEQLHETTLFPRLCATQALQDEELEHKIMEMENVDLTQVGIPAIEQQEPKSLANRITRGILSFEKIGSAKSPQAMVEHLLDTARTLTKTDDGDAVVQVTGEAEKSNVTVVTMNADMLVSLLLIVVIRAKVSNLHACLSYMRNFVFVEDVEQGEIGYILSTLEAVLFHIAQDHTLSAASQANEKLWRSIKKGNIKGVAKILERGRKETENDGPVSSEESSEEEEESLVSGLGLALNDIEDDNSSSLGHQPTVNGASPTSEETPHVKGQENGVSKRPESGPASRRHSAGTGSVSSVTTISDLSISSMILSRTGTSQSQHRDAFSAEKLSKTRNPQGESLLMMAIQYKQPEMLQYLLDLPFFDVYFILEDRNSEGATLLSVAVQVQSMACIEILLGELSRLSDEILQRYLKTVDTFGRTVAHYLFSTPDLITRLGRWLPWTSKDKNGQTPLFALCRSYDHHRYKEMVGMAIKEAQIAQGDCAKLHLDEHVDAKGNTLLHIAGDPSVVRMLLRCDSDVNAVNDKGFTPLMVASKYGRLEMVRTLFGDARVDILAKDLRGMTAVELAKDDDVRNRIDDLVLFQNTPGEDGRVTAVVRSYFVEDATVRLMLKSGAPSAEESSTITVTTCRRSLTDFQFLAKWLQFENPASWLPALPVSRSPYQIPSKPSRAVLRDIQLRVDNFLRTLLIHPTFSTHELLWEFFLVPEMQYESLILRSKRKAEARAERVREEFTPVEEVREVEMFVSFAKDSVRSINYAVRSVTRRATVVRSTIADLPDTYKSFIRHLNGFKFLVNSPHLAALTKFTEVLVPSESHPYTLFLEDLRNIQASLTGVANALERPRQIINEMAVLQKQVDRQIVSLRRSDRWPLGLLDDTRAKYHQEAAQKAQAVHRQRLELASELRHTQSVAAQELAAFHEMHAKQARRAIRELARKQVVVEKERLEGMKRALKLLKQPVV
ncbi:hypothetical protein FN846DRAFT_776654 [Sphaerosporella brunnea]|uniref:VPS9 domain-containing protein n=1 Tax=Sphaerosporella brunnea TaxID=1250544 RepID=A0A5J5F0G1_9PEZI|nr:hypothetical protein FN846DRAFT_776654 [Sphaerosporella brunnea]